MDTSAPTPIEQLISAVARATTSTRRLADDARNAHHNYSYTSAEAVLEECRTALANEGLMVWTDWRMGEDRATDERTLIVTRRLYHSSGACLEGEPSEWPVIAQRGRPWDKAISGVLTASLAYWLRDLLMLPRGKGAAEEEPAGRDDTSYEPRQQAPAPTKRSADFDEAKIRSGFAPYIALATEDEAQAIEGWIARGDTSKCRDWLRALMTRSREAKTADMPSDVGSKTADMPSDVGSKAADVPSDCAHERVDDDGMCLDCGVDMYDVDEGEAAPAAPSQPGSGKAVDLTAAMDEMRQGGARSYTVHRDVSLSSETTVADLARALTALEKTDAPRAKALRVELFGDAGLRGAAEWTGVRRADALRRIQTGGEK